MKEATGELSTTVITIVAIGLVIAIFTTFLLPTLRAQIALSQACAGGPGYSTEPEATGFVHCGGVGSTESDTSCPKGATKKGFKLCNANEATGQSFGCVYCRETDK